MIHLWLTTGFGLMSEPAPGVEAWRADFVAVYPDGSEAVIKNRSEIRVGDRWGESAYLIDRIELERRGSAAGDRARVILRLETGAEQPNRRL